MPALRTSHALTGTVLIISLLAAFGLWKIAQHNARQELQNEFDFHSDELALHIKQRMDAYEAILHGVRGLFDTSNNITREDFREYVASLRLEEYYPGIQGLSHTRLIPRDRLEEHIAAVRADSVAVAGIVATGSPGSSAARSCATLSSPALSGSAPLTRHATRGSCSARSSAARSGASQTTGISDAARPGACHTTGIGDAARPGAPTTGAGPTDAGSGARGSTNPRCWVVASTSGRSRGAAGDTSPCGWFITAAAIVGGTGNACQQT